MELGFTHRALQPQQQPIVEMGGIIHAVFIENERVRERAQLEQAVPVRGIARQAGDFEPEHNAGAAEADLGHQALKALAVGRGP